MKKKKKKARRFFTFLFVALMVLGVVYHKKFLKIYFPVNYKEYVYKYSLENGLDPYLVFSVIKVESNFRCRAESHKNAMGLMQIMPDTGKWIAKQMNIIDFKVDDLNDPEKNIMMGCWYINDLKKEFEGDMKLVLAAYNGGRGNVNKWLQDKRYSQDGFQLKKIPFEETEKYVLKVGIIYKIYNYIYKQKQLSLSAAFRLSRFFLILFV